MSKFLAGLGLSKQIVDALHKAGIHTKEDLQARRDSLAGIRGIGDQTIKALLAVVDPAPTNAQAPTEPGLGASENAAGGESDAALPRQGEVVILCPYHQLQCKSGKSEAFFTRYYCPHEDCAFSHKEPRPNMQSRLRRAQAEEGFSARTDRP